MENREWRMEKCYRQAGQNPRGGESAWRTWRSWRLGGPSKRADAHDGGGRLRGRGDDQPGCDPVIPTLRQGAPQGIGRLRQAGVGAVRLLCTARVPALLGSRTYRTRVLYLPYSDPVPTVLGSCTYRTRVLYLPYWAPIPALLDPDTRFGGCRPNLRPGPSQPGSAGEPTGVGGRPCPGSGG